MAKKSVNLTVSVPDASVAKCPHCSKPVNVDHTDKITKDDGTIIRPAHTYNTKTHTPGHFCEHCNGPLDAVALKNTNVNFGDENSRANLYSDLKDKVESFQDSL